MSAWEGGLVRAYGHLLRLYPAGFQAEYAAEMRAVFAAAAAAATVRGRGALALAGWREVRDLPSALWQAHWHAWRRQEGTMLAALELNWAAAADDGRPGSRPAAALAALPHGLAAGVMVLGPLAPESAALGIVLLVTFSAALLGGAVIAHRQGWPRWSASWCFYWLLLGLAGLGYGGYLLGLWNSQTAMEAAFVGVIALALPLALYGLAQRDRLSGLLLALPVLPLLWFPALEFVPGAIRNLLQPAMWLATAGVAYGLTRRGSVRLGFWLALALNLAIGCAVAYSRAYLRVYPSDAPAHWQLEVPTLADFLYWLIPPLTALSTLIIGPLLARALWQMGTLSGTAGRWATRVAIVGLILALLGHFGSFFRYLGMAGLRPTVFSAPLTAATYGGLLLLAGGTISFLAAPLPRTRRDNAFIALLALALINLPFAAMLPLWIGFRLQPTDVPFGFLQLDAHPLETFAAALLWTLLAGGLAAYVSGRRPAPSETPAA